MAIQARHASASISLHRKLLFPHLPPAQALPQIIPGDDKEILILNDKIYHLIALAFRAYILSWLPRITKDQSLLPQINDTVLLPILRPICTRLVNDPSCVIDFALLDLPSLITLHVKTSEDAKVSRGLGITWEKQSFGEAYHARLPLLALELSEDGRGYELSPLWLTGLVEAIMRLHLPEEYDCLPERIMVRELVGRVILGGVGRKISQPWFWWSLALKLIPPRVQLAGLGKLQKQDRSDWDMGTRWIRRLWTWAMLFWSCISWTIVTLAVTPPLRPRYRHCALPALHMVRAVITKPSWTLRILLAVLELLLTFFSPVVDGIIPYLLETHLTTPTMAIRLVDLLEKILFPLDGYPAPTPDDPTPEESAAMKRALEQRISEVVPSFAMRFLPPPSTFLEPLSDASCNSHLVGMVYNAAVGTLMPELLAGESGVADTIYD